jgi:hypothetical protein
VIRSLAWFSLAVQPVFWSGLPGRDVGLPLLGASLVALGVAVALVLPRRPASATAAGLFAASGIAFAVASLDYKWLGLAATALLLLTPYAISRALWPSPVAAAALAGGNVGFWLAAGTWTLLLLGDDGTRDVVRPLGFLVVHEWVAMVVVGLLHETRRPREPGPLIPVRPKDFLATEWTGEGELVLRPLFLGRSFGQRFAARRSLAWADDRVWRVDDEARFARGHVERRQMWCEFVADDHVRLTAGDLPDGADVWVEEGGFRIAPFRVAFQLGPVPWLGECRDRSRVLADGTFVNEFDAYTLGLPIPVARLTFRMRPVESTAAAGAKDLAPATSV